MSGLWYGLDDEDDDEEIEADDLWGNWGTSNENDDEQEPDLDVILDKVCQNEDLPWLIEAVAKHQGLDVKETLADYLPGDSFPD